MKRLSPIRIPRVFRHGPSLLDSSPTKFLPPASSGTLFTTFFRHSQLCDPSCQLLCSAARPQHTSTPPLHSIQFAYGPRPPQSRAASFKSLYRKRANTPYSCRRLAPSRFRYNPKTFGTNSAAQVAKHVAQRPDHEFLCSSLLLQFTSCGGDLGSSCLDNVVR